jgi:predicted ATPase
VLREVRLGADHPRDEYPFGLAAVAALPLALTAPVTVLVGENGAGKSTLLEAIAVEAGFNPEGGSGHVTFDGTPTHSALHRSLTLSWSPHRLPLGWFLRAESFYNVATHREANPGPRHETSYHQMSHGESFLDVARDWFDRPSFFVLDEPEAGLSFGSQLALIAAIGRGVAAGGQFVMATHSPVLMAVPGADVLQLGPDGIERCAYEDLETVRIWTSFLETPDLFLRHLGPDAD